jgi:hypothetical protein
VVDVEFVIVSYIASIWYMIQVVGPFYIKK